MGVFSCPPPEKKPSEIPKEEEGKLGTGKNFDLGEEVFTVVCVTPALSV